MQNPHRINFSVSQNSPEYGPEQCELKTTKISLATSRIEMQITNGDLCDSDSIAGRFEYPPKLQSWTLNGNKFATR